MLVTDGMVAGAVDAALAYLDPLTGLANRRRMDRELALAVTAAHAGARTLALIALYLSGFKPTHGAPGRPVGDGVLFGVGDRMSRVRRPAELLSRLGGDEFVV